MIPFAILSCVLQTKTGEMQEIRAIDLSTEGFTFRLSHEDAGLLRERPRFVTLGFYERANERYNHVTLSEYTIAREEETAFYVLFRLRTQEAVFRICAENLMREYLEYIDLKLSGDDAALSQALTGYPAAGEGRFAPTLEAQRRQWYSALCPDEGWLDAVHRMPEIALQLDEPELWEQYAQMPLGDFVRWYFRRFGLPECYESAAQVNCLYMGNSYCPHLSPEEEMLENLLRKAISEGVHPVIVLPPAAEHDVSEVTDRIRRLVSMNAGERPLEVVVNDWGMLTYLSENYVKEINVTLGILLNKRRKDSRFQYYHKHSEQLNGLEENALNAPFFRNRLAEMGVSRFSCECCGYLYRLPEGRNALHLPFYQMNTATHCTLYARCCHGDRGHQSPVAHCPRYCRDYAFLYPEMLSMVGRFNTLFGYYKRAMTDGKFLSGLLEQGVDRLVFGFL